MPTVFCYKLGEECDSWGEWRIGNPKLTTSTTTTTEGAPYELMEKPFVTMHCPTFHPLLRDIGDPAGAPLENQELARGVPTPRELAKAQGPTNVRPLHMASLLNEFPSAIAIVVQLTSQLTGRLWSSGPLPSYAKPWMLVK